MSSPFTTEFLAHIFVVTQGTRLATQSRWSTCNPIQLVRILTVHVRISYSKLTNFVRNYNHVSSLWEYEGWIKEKTAQQAMTHYAAYSVRRHDGLRIITLNTDFCTHLFRYHMPDGMRLDGAFFFKGTIQTTSTI
jgi:hypothetical protein